VFYLGMQLDIGQPQVLQKAVASPLWKQHFFSEPLFGLHFCLTYNLGRGEGHRWTSHGSCLEGLDLPDRGLSVRERQEGWGGALCSYILSSSCPHTPSFSLSLFSPAWRQHGQRQRLPGSVL
jgi:hypothetical protein